MTYPRAYYPARYTPGRDPFAGQRAAHAQQRVAGARRLVWLELDQNEYGDTSHAVAVAKDYALALGRKFEVDDIEDAADCSSLCAGAVQWAQDYAGDFAFVLAIRSEWNAAHCLSYGAIKGILNCLRAEAIKEAKVEEENGAFRDNLRNVVTLFAKVRETRTKGHIVFRVLTEAGETIKVTEAGSDSRNPGCFYVKRDDLYVGKITQTGEVDARLDREHDIIEALRALNGDPLETLRHYGRITGHCGICGRLLVDPVSIAAGIGPICAGGAGL